ncbi:L,D-transpeptidase [Gordonia sp. X0973]|uniref:L,D-transpeptidase n=1 Tax=Gordonia sp. X0973 TaxID=2742602 RepID=UPI001582CD2F|nr:Ig-like domain-containing protein [Gordonia sp. X0973]QKT06889.1 L,D-transpeptidase [Gordonia sp. X0973]
MSRATTSAAVVALAFTVGLGTVSCTKSPSYSDQVGKAENFQNEARPQLTVTGWQNKPLKDQAVGIMPGAPITVSARDGQISDVNVVGPNGPVPGKLSDDGLQWQSTATLSYGSKYTVTANAHGVAGESAEKVGFATSSASSLADASTTTADGESVGVGQTVGINFDAPVSNKLNAQRAITVTTDPPVEGAFYWINESMVRWRPKDFWKPGTKVSFQVKTKGIDLGDGVYGANNLASHFTVGRRLIGIADDKTKILNIFVDGKLVKSMPTSMGKDSTPTNTGVYMVAERVPSVIMDSSTYGVPVNSPAGYKEVVYSASRISFSGIYVHSAPWSLGDQGNTDVSNGCLNVSPDNALWFMQNAKRGDLIIVKNTVGPPLPGDDGLGDWNVPWERWKKGNATS